MTPGVEGNEMGEKTRELEWVSFRTAFNYVPPNAGSEPVDFTPES